MSLPVFDNTCILLAKAEQKHFQYTKEVLQKAELGITPVQMLVLYTLFKEDGISISELGKRCYLDNSTLTGVIDRLEALGLVTRNDSPEDRRAYIVHLTAKALAAKPKIEEVSRQVYGSMLEGCSEAEIETFRNVLLRIFANL
jgi:DNA-binding MarR family transcriptional regulator